MFFKNSYIPKNYEESKLNIDIIQKLKFINIVKACCFE